MPRTERNSSPGRRNGKVDKAKQARTVGKPKRITHYTTGPHSRVEFVSFTPPPVTPLGVNQII